MSSIISYTNEHPFLDPAFARSEIEAHFSNWIVTGRAMTAYASDLLMRALASNDKTVVNLVIIGALFRQTIVAADGCLVCLENGAVQGAMLHSRAMFEAGASLQWVLSRDRERWARQFYVSSLRQLRSWIRRRKAGTAEFAAHSRAWESIGLPSSVASSNADIDAAIQEIDDLLAISAYAGINHAFDQASIVGKGKRRSHVEPAWYEPGPGGARSIFDLAKQIGREAEYVTVYRYFSYFTHGSLATNGFRTAGGMATIEPARYLRDFSLAFNWTFMDFHRTIRSMVSLYRAGELAEFEARTSRDWIPALRAYADVVVSSQQQLL